MCSRVAVALSVDVLPRLDHFGSQVSEQFHVGLLLVLVMASRPSIVLNYVLKRFDLSETICRFTDLQVKAENLWHLLTVEAPLAFLRALLQQTPWRESLAVGSQQSQWKTILLVLQRVVCIVLVFTKFHFFFLFLRLGFLVLSCFGFWVFRQSSCSNFALARCISRVDYSGGHCGWNSVAQALVASWLQKWCWKSALQPECQVLRTVKNKTPGGQLRTKKCKWACAKILKNYTRRESLFLKLHSFTAAALKVFPNWSSSWCCWSAGQNAIYMESKSTLKV